MPLSEKTDHELVHAALAEDRGSFSTLVERYVSPIYKFSYRYVRNGPDAEDIAQETFLRVWKNLKKFDQTKNFKTWIFTIAKNASLDLLKKKKTFHSRRSGKRTMPSTPSLRRIVAIADTSKDVFDQDVLKEDFDAALARLPERYRDVMVMRYTDNLKFREIAERLHEPVDTVKSRHRRGSGAFARYRGWRGVLRRTDNRPGTVGFAPKTGIETVLWISNHVRKIATNSFFVIPLNPLLSCEEDFAFTSSWMSGRISTGRSWLRQRFSSFLWERLRGEFR